MRSDCAWVVGFSALVAHSGDGAPVPPRDIAAERAAAAALAAPIDAALQAEWAQRGVVPAAPIDDATWLRRASLDLRGTIPAASEVAAFLADPSNDRRERKLDDFLADPGFAEFLAADWTFLLLQPAGANGERVARHLEAWLAEAIGAGTPFPELTRQMLATAGEALDPGPMALQLAYWNDPEQLAGTVAKAFLGLQIQCAQCHDHPTDHWTRNQFNQFAAFFTATHADKQPSGGSRGPRYRVLDRSPEWSVQDRLARIVRRSRDGDAGDGGMAESTMAGAAAAVASESSVAAAREVLRMFRRHADLDRPAPPPPDVAELTAALPALAADARELIEKYLERRSLFGELRFLDGALPSADAAPSRRATLAAWITSPANEWFAAAIVNRAFGHCFGQGLVVPVDDLSGSKDRIAPELLATVGRAFLAGGGDLRVLYRAMVSTRAWAAGNASATDPTTRRAAERCLSAHPVRSLTPGQLARSLLQVTSERPLQRRAVEREHAALKKELLQLVTGLDAVGERRVGASIPLALFMMNGPFVDRTAALRRSPVGQTLANESLPPTARLAPLWYVALGRPPREPEAAELLAAVAAGESGDAEKQFNDLFWALLNSAEFQRNH